MKGMVVDALTSCLPCLFWQTEAVGSETTDTEVSSHHAGAQLGVTAAATRPGHNSNEGAQAF